MKTDYTTHDVELLKQRVTELESELQQSQSALRKVQQRYHDLFENSGDSVFIVDVKTFRIIDANMNAARRFGYSHHELLQLTIDDLEVFDLYQAETDQVFWESSTSGTRFYECQYRRKDGSYATVEVSSRAGSVDGRTVIQNHVRDVTSRREAERARRQAETEALRLVTVIEQATETIMITRMDGTIVYVNPYFEQSTGYTVEEVVGKKSSILVLPPLNWTEG